MQYPFSSDYSKCDECRVSEISMNFICHFHGWDGVCRASDAAQRRIEYGERIYRNE